ncbi:hypothetical protein M407DRAFT_23588 [Tulasnella calospora MUT 4182]|uniref:F-box domain-containing protein n=1 Tax=Tulasnella calospora MUT 4182 TaxID=1051891 RepID=A0A0C3QJB8_9AGAM|nr:hypothetical protein M407DRAFT_23588 [Tulasnella calospora MUT 4182]
MLDLPDELLVAILLSLNLETIFNTRRTVNDGLQSTESLDHPVRSATRGVRAMRLEKLVQRALVNLGAFDPSSHLVCTDLDAITPGQFDLLRYPEPGFIGEGRRIALHVETDSDALAFTIAVTYYSSASDWDSNDACRSVWLVKLEELGRFNMTHRSIFPLVYPEDFGNNSFVMKGDLLLRGTDHQYVRVFEIFDYLNCSNHQLRRGLVVLPREGSLPQVDAIRIMPYDGFLVVASGILQLFNIQKLSDMASTSLHMSSGLEYPLWIYKFEPCIPGCLPAITPPHLAFRRLKDPSFGLRIQANSIFLSASFPSEAFNILNVYEIVMERQADGMKALMGSHRVWYDRGAELLLPYLTTFKVSGSKNVIGELAETGLYGSSFAIVRPPIKSVPQRCGNSLREDMPAAAGVAIAALVKCRNCAYESPLNSFPRKRRGNGYVKTCASCTKKQNQYHANTNAKRKEKPGTETERP